jgi:hypothetical protein
MANESLMLEQLIGSRWRPGQAAALAHAGETARMVRLRKARGVRNFFMRVKGGEVLPATPTTFTVRTPVMSYDYMVTAINGGHAGDFVFNGTRLFLRARFDSTRPEITSDPVPGPVFLGGGDSINWGMLQQDEPVDLPLPLPVRAGEQVVFDMIVDGNAIATFRPEFTLHCLRVLPADDAAAQLPDEWARTAESQIKTYLPRMVYLKTSIDYTAPAPRDLYYTNNVKVPLLLLGITSDLRASRLLLRDELADYEFMPTVAALDRFQDRTVPSWAIAPSRNHVRGGIYWMQRPHLLIPGTRLEVQATDGLDFFDPPIVEDAQDVPHSIVWICQTV